MSRRMLMAVLSVVLITPALRAQDKPAEKPAEKPADSGSERDRGRDRGDRGGTDEERRARYSNIIKERLGEISDDEWKVIQPKLQKVMDIRRDQMSSMFGGFGRDRSSEEQPKAGIAGASADLRKALENKSATPEEISKKLTALREAKAKAKMELEAAQKELKEVLTQRQEATLVTLSMLD